MSKMMIQDICPWYEVGIEKRPSVIHGEGLFTTVPFARGAVVMRLGGYLYSISTRYEGNVMRSTSTSLSDEIILAEPAEGQKDLSDHINHSCDPNLGMLDAITVVAARHITAGEELVIDYAFWEADQTWILKSSCRCGAQCCRGRITGEDWKTIAASDHRFSLFSPFLRRRIMTHSKKGASSEYK